VVPQQSWRAAQVQAGPTGDTYIEINEVTDPIGTAMAVSRRQSSLGV